jgi:hypothetical protein
LDLDCAADSDADVDGKADAATDPEFNVNPGVSADDGAKTGADSDSDADADGEADAGSGADASGMADANPNNADPEFDTRRSSRASSFPSPVRERTRERRKRAAAHTERSSSPVHSDIEMSDAGSSALQNVKAAKGKGKAVESKHAVHFTPSSSQRRRLKIGSAKNPGKRLSPVPLTPFTIELLKRKRPPTPEHEESPPLIRAAPGKKARVVSTPVPKKRPVKRSGKNAVSDAMMAAFPVDPVKKGDSLGYADILEPSTEPETARDTELSTQLPPRGQRKVLNLELPMAVYDRQADEVNMKLRPFHFPYAAQVLNTRFLLHGLVETDLYWQSFYRKVKRGKPCAKKIRYSDCNRSFSGHSMHISIAGL